MRFGRILGSLAACAVMAVFSASAWAQSYTVSTTTGAWVTPPGNATTLSLNVDDGTVSFGIPFAFPYWGTTKSAGTALYVCSNGYASFSSSLYTYHYSPITYPYVSGNSDYDGFIAVGQRDGDGRYSPAVCNYWQDTVGTNPAIKRLVVSWNNWEQYSHQGANSINFQVQFYETGKIVMAYTGSWGTKGPWGIGMDNPNSSGSTFGIDYVTPTGNGTSSYTACPSTDFVYSPPITITGTILFDRYIVDNSGIGNTSDQARPLAGMRVEQRDSTGTLGFAITDSTGFFKLTGANTGGTGTIVVTSQSGACAVRKTAGGPLYAATVASNVNFAVSAVSIGTVQMSESTDPGGINRAPINIARSVQQAYDWAKARTSKTITFVDPVLYDTTSSAASSYTAPIGINAAQMRVASSGSSNPDPWDVSVIQKNYGRHILGSVSGFPTATYDNTLDLVTTQQNAFAEGFGYYTYFAVNGANLFFFYDGISKSQSNMIDMENYLPAVAPKGPDVAGWAAAALYDLTDSSLLNETWDTYDGSTPTAIERGFRAAANLTTAATPANFFTSWNNLGYDTAALARNFIRHGLILDDSDEPNDYPTETKLLTQFGFIRKNRVLTTANEDWFEFLMPDPTNKLGVSVIFDRTVYPTTVLIVQTINAAGQVVATGTVADAASPYVAATGSLPAGNYRVRVALQSGNPLADYTVQAFSELAFKSGAFQPWTVGRPINVPVDIKGGIPPYTLTVLAPFEKPDGLQLDGVNLRVGGVPTGPQDAPIPVGGSFTYGFILSAQDAATPANTASGPINFTVNDRLRTHYGEFMAVAYDKDLNMEAAFTGGTAPYTTTVEQGQLPSGVKFAPNELIVTGKADVPGSYPVQFTGSDIAGSTATTQVTGVVTTALGTTTPLALGASAAGFYFDAVQGSTVNVAIKTAPKHPKRPLHVVVLDTDGTTELATKTKGGKGTASVSSFVAPSTGRFYVVASSDNGDATLLVAKGKVAPPKKGSGENPDINFVAGKTYAVKFGAIAGSKLTLTAKATDGSGLALRALYLVDPQGTTVTLDTADSKLSASGSVTVTKILPQSEAYDASGTWKLVLGALPGPQGHFAYSFKVAPPRAGTYKFD